MLNKLIKINTNNKVFKPLTIGKNRIDGRNNQGRITVRHRGGGHKRLYRCINFTRALNGPYRFPEKVKVLDIHYDPNRSSFIALVSDLSSQEHFYILSPKDISKGDILTSGYNIEIKPGNKSILEYIPLGTQIHNIELIPGKGAQLIRSAGTSALLLKKEILKNIAMVRLNSGQIKLIPLNCSATIGQVSNLEHKNKNYMKAGRKRWLGFRPTVRGVAMNPIDHPHGGGEGKTSGGRPSCSPWGKPTKGLKTRKLRNK
jgi:large subunit ribosomal protein L2